MRFRWRVGFLVSALILTTGCAVVSGHLKPPVARPGGAGLRVGTAKVDITPMPGFSMAGHGVAGKTARGYWTRLYARVIYLEGDNSDSVVLVVCSLVGIPGGLIDRIAEIVRASDGGQHIGRDQIVIAATHTHHAPGNFFTAELYNGFAAKYAGFDQRLFEFFAQRIAAGIVSAAKNPRPAVLKTGDSLVPLLARNRSFDAFLLNPESSQILRDNATLPVGEPSPAYPDREAFRAVIPRLTVLKFEAREDPADTIAVAAFIAVHGTAMGHETELYNGDLFEVASHAAEQTLARRNTRPVVAVFNGAEGDVSPYWKWDHQDRSDTLRLGRLLASAIVQQPLDGPIPAKIDYRFDIASLPNQCLRNTPTQGPWAGQRPCTALEPMMGAAAVGGAPDGRTVFHDLGWKERVKGPRQEEGQGPKQPAFDPSIFRLPQWISITRFTVTPSSVPQEVALGVYRVGNVLLGTLPGEFTTVMGRRIAAGIRASAQAVAMDITSVVLIGLANEYTSYTTTPEEYEMQNYEGASTLYGPITGPLIGEKLADLTASFKEERKLFATRKFSYRPGPRGEFGISEVGRESPLRPDDGLSNVVQDETGGQPLRTLPSYCWSDGVPAFSASSPADARLTPSVSIQEYGNDRTWQPLVIGGVPESDEGLNFVTVVFKPDQTSSRWCAIWLRPSQATGKDKYRFSVTTVDPALGPVLYSDPF